ncbi:hypothetical protein PM10SUCC1_19530 [Propionigenium maris DSM 9537]|uniref:Uncharacterized protein n=1 Tax=Propionigenium maris DSM 9537 TaxID=1123000 RepID=A0A9W6GJR9_9FUSO|nr:hypothetical protein PM10SUCC1_19530 [Propionigenium maris DSM 9537]
MKSLQKESKRYPEFSLDTFFIVKESIEFVKTLNQMISVPNYYKDATSCCFL